MANYVIHINIRMISMILNGYRSIMRNEGDGIDGVSRECYGIFTEIIVDSKELKSGQVSHSNWCLNLLHLLISAECIFSYRKVCRPSSKMSVLFGSFCSYNHLQCYVL